MTAKDDVLKLKQVDNTYLLRVNMKYQKIEFTPNGKIKNNLTRRQKYFVLSNMD